MAVDPFIGEISIVAFEYAPSGWLPCDGRILNVNECQALFALIGNRYGGDGQKTFALPDLRGRLPVGMGLGPKLTTPRMLGQQGGAEQTALAVGQLPVHAHGVAAHSHAMPHAHAQMAHDHPMPHSHPVGSHSHSMPHSHDMASHSHSATHGHEMNASSTGGGNDPTGCFPAPAVLTMGSGKVFGSAGGKVMNSGVISQNSTPTGGPSVANTGASSAANTGDASGGNTGAPSSASTGSSGGGTTGDCSVKTGVAALSTDTTGTGAKVDVMSPFLCLNFIIAVEGVFPPRSE